MMKKKRFGLVLLVLVVCLNACGRENGANSSEKTEEQVKKIEEKQDEIKPEEQNKVEGLKDSDMEKEVTVVLEPMTIVTYFSNDDATAFISEEVQIDALTPEEVLNALISKGAVAADVQILAFNTVTVDDKPTIEIDFNSAFATFVTNMGSTGEYFAIGSICNTFLNAYDCEQIKITVEGQTLTTGHAEYPGYMTTFE